MKVQLLLCNNFGQAVSWLYRNRYYIISFCVPSSLQTPARTLGAVLPPLLLPAPASPERGGWPGACAPLRRSPRLGGRRGGRGGRRQTGRTHNQLFEACICKEGPIDHDYHFWFPSFTSHFDNNGKESSPRTRRGATSTPAVPKARRCPAGRRSAPSPVLLSGWHLLLWWCTPGSPPPPPNTRDLLSGLQGSERGSWKGR